MAADTIRFIVTVAIVVYKGLIPVVGRMLTDYVHFFFFSGSKPPEKILIQEILCINMQNLFAFSSEIFRFSAYFLVFCSRFLSETRLLDGRHDRI